MKLLLKDVTLENVEIVANTMAGLFESGDIVVLVGDIGAGKTTFVSAYAKAMEVSEPVTSPTFAIVAEYTSDKVHLVHVDTYRLTHVNEIFDLGIETIFRDDAITMVEWGERIEDVLEKKHLRMIFNDDVDESRDITIEWDPEIYGDRSETMHSYLVKHGFVNA